MRCGGHADDAGYGDGFATEAEVPLLLDLAMGLRSPETSHARRAVRREASVRPSTCESRTSTWTSTRHSAALRAALTVTRSVTVGWRPWGIDVTRDGRTVVVACQVSRDVYLVDTASWTSVVVPLGAGTLPLDVEIDDARRRTFVTWTASTPAPDVVFVIDLDAAVVIGSFDPADDGEAVIAVQPQATAASILIAVTDADADGRLFACDNCPDAANPGQEDADGDGVGDACEVAIRCDEPSAIDLAPGVEPLRVAKDGGSLRLTWQDLPGQATNACAGSLASLHASAIYDHGNVGACALARGATVAMPPSDAYLLVAGA